MVGASAVPAFFNLAHFSPTLILAYFFRVRFFSLSASGTDDQHDDVFQLGGIAGSGIALGIFVRKYAELGFYETL